MRETDETGLNKQSPQGLTDEQIVSVPRRSFLAVTGAVLVGGAAALVLGNTVGAQSQDPDKPRQQDPDKPRPNDPDKPRPADPDKPKPQDPDNRPNDPDKPRPQEPDKPRDPDKPRPDISKGR